MGSSYLDAVRARVTRCVGRETLKAKLVERYRSEERRLVVLVGAGGIGKTTLATWLAQEVLEGGGAVAWVSGEQVAPNPESFIAALRVSGAASDLNEVGRGAVRDLVVIDSFERLRAMRRWVFRDFLAQLGDNVLVVLASREHVASRELDEVGLYGAVVELTVDALSNDEAEALLAQWNVAEPLRARIAAAAHGFPLAMRLLAERGTPDGEVVEVSPAVLAELVEAFVSRAPSAAHVAAIHLAAIAKTSDESMLTGVIDGAPEGLFDWLAQTAIAERTAFGISLHALVREVVFTHLQQRDPELLERMQARILDVLAQRMVSTDVTSAHELLLQGFYARRNSPSVGRLLALEDTERCEVVALAPQHLPRVRKLIEKFEGPTSLDSFERWLTRQPLAHVVVGGDGAIVSFQVVIRVPRDATADHLTDPLIDMAWKAWRARNPPASDGDLHLFRWFIEAGTHQRFGPAMTHLMTLGPIITLPIDEIVQIGFVTTPPEQWAPFAPNFNLEWAHGTELDFDGQRWGCAFGDVNKLRRPFARTGATTLNAMRLIVYLTTGLAPPTTPLIPSLPAEAVSREYFGQLLRAALNHLHEPQQLRDVTLAPLVPASDGPLESAIPALVVDGIRRLAADDATSRHARILEVTYVRPTVKQHAAAVDLGLPYGTYRYQLRKAVAVLEDVLWQDRGRPARRAFDV
ncbi:MAG: hypothetical protein SFX73_34060 [Kofleriaceae bacterium]|nr:hypothetical protein [Kofleriaceae bacterium]